MKDRHVCPKCSFNRILHLTEVADRVGDFSAGEPVGGNKPNESERASSYAWRLARQAHAYRTLGLPAIKETVAGLVEAYVCKKCGFTEFYTREPGSLPVDGTHIRELVGPEAGAFR
jgi:predicted nucleic-acid-binding Zn-ribbon protein